MTAIMGVPLARISTPMREIEDASAKAECSMGLVDIEGDVIDCRDTRLVSQPFDLSAAVLSPPGAIESSSEKPALP